MCPKPTHLEYVRVLTQQVNSVSFANGLHHWHLRRCQIVHAQEKAWELTFRIQNPNLPQAALARVVHGGTARLGEKKQGGTPKIQFARKKYVILS